MLYQDSQLYQAARATKLGQAELSDVLERLRRSISQHYSVNVVHVVYDTIDKRDGTLLPRLNLILETSVDCTALMKDRFSLKRDVQQTILRRFSRFVAECESPEAYDTNDIFLIFDNFSEEAMRLASASFLESDAQRVIAEFAHRHVWMIDSVSSAITVFYRSDEDIRTNAANGCRELLTQRCYELTSAYDEFHYFSVDHFPIRFDSKENLDANYEGGLFYYYH
ncbi:MAG: hypothetical protein JWN70_2521 [Planctomycetaceae bacterium]|nr:hypothetical protein [Planctomycetaceae bacterium]